MTGNLGKQAARGTVRVPDRRRVSRRTRVVVLAVAASVSVAVGATAYFTSRGAAAPTLRVVPLGSMGLSSGVQDIVTGAAREANVDPDTLVGVSPVGTGAGEKAALVARDGSGRTEMSFYNGFGMTSFTPIQSLMKGSAIYVNLSMSGPATETRDVGLVGVARPDVARVAILHADGTAEDAALAASNGYSFFALTADGQGSFPTAVRAYGSNGEPLAEEPIDTRPLCPLDDPHCLDR